DAATVGGPLGRGGAGRLGVGAHDPGSVRDQLLRLLAVQGGVMRIGRRPTFFVALALLCLLLYVPTPTAYRWVNLFAGGLALFWGVLLFLEERSVLRFAPVADRRSEPGD